MARLRYPQKPKGYDPDVIALYNFLRQLVDEINRLMEKGDKEWR